MLKKLVIGGLVAVLLGAAATGAYDYLRGDSTLAYQDRGDDVAAGNGQGNNGSRGAGGNGIDSDRTSANGNAGNSDHSSGGQNLAAGEAEPQAMVDEWITVSGAVESVEGGALTMKTADGEMVVVQLGPEHFWSSQELTLNAGDEIEVLGFYEGADFTAGDILLASGEHIMLRDPNGRPLWAGGSASGQAGNSAGGRGQESASGESSGGNSVAGQGEGSAEGGQESQAQAMVADWITVEGTVTAVELGALSIRTADSDSMLVHLGPESFWTTQGIVFEAGDQVEILGFYEDEVNFGAGQITLQETGETLVLRDADGRPLWSGGLSNGGGNGYRGG